MTDLDSCSVDEILLKRRDLRRKLLASEGFQDLRIAVLCGSTADEVVNLLELLLLAHGFRATFHQSDYGRYYEEAVYNPQALIEFKPDLVYVHTSFRNTQHTPPISCPEEQFQVYVDAEVRRYSEIWDALDHHLGCQIIQNNFEIPPYAILGNRDAVSSGGRTRFFMQLNAAFAQAAAGRSKLLVQDVLGLSARVGLRHWFDWNRYFAYKILLTADANLEVARSLSSIIRAIYGKSRKVLVLDLDNTLWGGVIGDDGVDNILIGPETAVAEAYTAFQEYCLSLRDRGILLAACSKNDDAIARSGFAHPSSVLKVEHFSSFKANWLPKHENLLAIADELCLGVGSFVFVDDNPAERSIVEAQLPGVAVPDIGTDVTRFIDIIEQGRYFEPTSLSKEDLERATLYSQNSRRAAFQAQFADYGEYLDSLKMVAEIGAFKPVYLERIAQLTNKTNQFNLTTRRYTAAELDVFSRDAKYVCVYGKLTDRFGDHGLISVVMGRREVELLFMDLWLMSCRVLKRDMEYAMLDAVVERAGNLGIRTICGYYLPTTKNTMVAEFYPSLGFEPLASPTSGLPAGSIAWRLQVSSYTGKNTHIRVAEHPIA